MDLDQRSVRNDLHDLRNELMVIRGTAQLLLRRLRRDQGECRHLEACQTIIEQTQVMERSIDRFASHLSSQDWVRIDRELPLLRDTFQLERQS